MTLTANEGKGLYEFGPFRLDPAQGLLFRGGQPVPLQPKAFNTLLVLVRNSERVVLKDELLNAVWADTFVEESNLTQNIFVLRKALREHDACRFILTVPGRGYRLTEKARFVPQSSLHPVTSISLEDERRRGPSRERAAVLGVTAVRGPGRSSRMRRWRQLLLVVLIAGAVVGAFLIRDFIAPVPKVLRSVQLTSVGNVEPFGAVLTDGARLYFGARIGGTVGLAQVSDKGGEPIPVFTSIAGIALFDIDRRGSRLLLGAVQANGDEFGPLWAVPTSGGSAQRLGDAIGTDAVWSPDGQSVAYARDGRLFVASDEGQQPRKLFAVAGVIEHPRWSPDGRRLAFTVRDKSAARSLWEIRADGSDAHALDLGWKPYHIHWGDGERCGDWSPDGRVFIFHSDRDNVQSLWAIREEGGWFHRKAAPVQLYTAPGSIGPTRFSVDGKRIFFVDYNERRELVRYDSAQKTFVPYLGGIPARLLSFSQDGQWVAYRNEADLGLWRSRPDGTQAVRLTFAPLEVLHSTWSPDGTRIAFEASGVLYTIPFDGGRPEPLLRENINAGQPSWSPDGNSILFTRWVTSADGTRTSLLFLFDLRNRRIQAIPDSQSFEDPQWSPEGRYIAAASRKDRALMLFDFATKKWMKLAEGSPYGWGIRWSRHGRYVYYQLFFAGEEQPIFRVRVSDHKVEQVASSHEILRADVLSFTMTGLTPDGSPLASFTHRNSNIIALDLDIP